MRPSQIIIRISISWHRDVPTETRVISDRVLEKLVPEKEPPKALVEKAEADRLSLSPRLRGSKLDEWIAQWIEENLDKKQSWYWQI